jgi:hypothetical protein
MNDKMSFVKHAHPRMNRTPRGTRQRSRGKRAATTQGAANIWLAFTLGVVVAVAALAMDGTSMVWACDQLQMATDTAATWLRFGG